MKISFKNKIEVGYVINMIVVLILGVIIWSRKPIGISTGWHWFGLLLILLSFGMLTTAYFIINAQLKAKNATELQLLENEKLLHSILENTTNAVSVKKINGEYLFINKQYESLFQTESAQIKGKTDHDFLPKEIADKYRSSDLEVLKLGKEIQVEEFIEQPEGLHTYLAVKFPLFDALNRVYAIGTISTDITERKASQELLVAGNTFFNMSKDMLIIAFNNTFFKVNPATLKILGYADEELLGRPVMDFVYTEDVDITLNEVKKLKTGATTVNFENRFTCKDGSLKWLNWTIFPDLKTGFSYAVARDVTINKEYEESLIAADCFFKMSVDILVISSKNKFIKINPSLSKVLGYSELEILNKSFTFFVFPEDLEATEKEIENLKNGTSLFNFKNRWLCKDGAIKWLSWNAISDSNTGIVYAIARDITVQLKLEEEEKAAVKELYESEQKLNLILEKISDGVVVANIDKQVVLANNMANKLFGTEDGTKISVNLSDHFDLFFPDEKTTFPVQDLPMERAFAGELTDDIDIVLWNPDSKKKNRVLLSGRPIHDSKNNVIAAVITIKDISKYKMMENELKKTELKYRNLIGFRKDINKKEQDKKD